MWIQEAVHAALAFPLVACPPPPGLFWWGWGEDGLEVPGLWGSKAEKGTQSLRFLSEEGREDAGPPSAGDTHRLPRRCRRASFLSCSGRSSLGVRGQCPSLARDKWRRSPGSVFFGAGGAGG